MTGGCNILQNLWSTSLKSLPAPPLGSGTYAAGMVVDWLIPKNPTILLQQVAWPCWVYWDLSSQAFRSWSPSDLRKRSLSPSASLVRSPMPDYQEDPDPGTEQQQHPVWVSKDLLSLSPNEAAPWALITALDVFFSFQELLMWIVEALELETSVLEKSQSFLTFWQSLAQPDTSFQ